MVKETAKWIMVSLLMLTFGVITGCPDASKAPENDYNPLPPGNEDPDPDPDTGVPSHEEDTGSVEVDSGHVPDQRSPLGSVCAQAADCQSDNCRMTYDGRRLCAPAGMACSDGETGGFAAGEGFCLEGTAIICSSTDTFDQENCSAKDCPTVIGRCVGGQCVCPDSCRNHTDCAEDAYCDQDDQCAALQADGALCTTNRACLNDNCRFAPTSPDNQVRRFCVAAGKACANPDGLGMEVDDSVCQGDVAWSCDAEDVLTPQNCGDLGCADGVCGDLCVPQCGDRQCGPDSCDGTCGDCLENEFCEEDAGLCLRNGWVLIRPGVFMMGSPEGELGRVADREGIRHQVTLTRPYLMKETSVTQAEWEAVMSENPSHFSECGGNCPVEMVSFWDVIAYLNLLSEADGLDPCYFGGQEGVPYSAHDAHHQAAPEWVGLDCTGYRLPTEAEWEYAVRAGTDTAVWGGNLTVTGNEFDPLLDPVAWYKFNSSATTHPVKQKNPNPWGLYDMLGNVWDWVWDLHLDYSGDPQVDPVIGGFEASGNRVIRGGSYSNDANFVRAAYRGISWIGNKFSFVGFRPVRTVTLP